MAVVIYPALVSGDQAQGYQAELVDFDNAQAAGSSPSELLAEAREKLKAALKALEEAGTEWPAPSPVEALAGRLQGGAALVLVDVQVDETPVRVNISIGERLLRRLDAAAEAQNMSRSGFIAAAVRARLDGGGGAGAGSAVREELSEIGRRLNQALGPDSAFSRTLADLDERALEGLRTIREHFAPRTRDKPD